MRLTCLLCLVLLIGCTAQHAPPSVQRDAAVVLRYTLYLDQEPPVPYDQTLRQAAAKVGGITVVQGKPTAPSKESQAWLFTSNDVQSELPPPKADYLVRFGHGLSTDDAARVSRSTNAVEILFTHTSEHAGDALQRADRIVLDMANKLGAWVWDVETRVLYSREAFRTERVEQSANARSQVVIHSYENNGHVRAVTLGMSKFALPDLEIEPYAWADNRHLGMLIVGLCQALIEGQLPDHNGDVNLDVPALEDKTVREYLSTDLLSHATQRGRFRLRPTTVQEGDADNRLLVVGFDHFDGPDLSARQSAATDALFGWNDEIKRITHDDELKQASAAARSKLPALRSAFNSGLRPGEYIQVKVPFASDSGGTEWMWVEIVAWDGDRIDGILRNEPMDVAALRGGQQVTAKTSEVFDYLRTDPDGEEEGNTTGEIIQRMQGKTETVPAR